MMELINVVYVKNLNKKKPTGVGYLCSICDVVFDFPRELEDHMTTHSTM